jgi:hypothetical protein
MCPNNNINDITNEINELNINNNAVTLEIFLNNPDNNEIQNEQNVEIIEEKPDYHYDDEEEWRIITNEYPTLKELDLKHQYKVSSHGRIWTKNLRGDGIMKQTKNKDYMRIGLAQNNSRAKINIGVHTLVAIMFHGLPENYEVLDVDHIDQDKCNNHKDNLRWVTRSENNKNCDNRKFDTCSTLTASFDIITKEMINVYESGKKAADEIGCSKSHISKACKNNNFEAKGYYWKQIKYQQIADAKVKYDDIDSEIEKIENINKTNENDNEWKTVISRNGLTRPMYEARRDGKIRNAKTKVLNNPKPDSKRGGAMTHYFSDKLSGKSGQVHDIIMCTFGTLPQNKKDSVLHINGDKTDNRFENLVWQTVDEVARRRADNFTEEAREAMKTRSKQIIN